MSCSRDPYTAYIFSLYDNVAEGVLLDIDVGPKAVGITMDNTTSTMAEDETVLRFGQKLQILDVEPKYTTEMGLTRSVMYVKGPDGI